MQRYLFILITGACIISSCKKPPGVNTRVLVHNATYNISNLSVQWNGTAVLSNPLTQGHTSGTATEPYLTLPAGTNNIILQSGSTVLANKNIYGGADVSYTLLLFDTSAASTAMNVALLTDDLSQTDTLYTKFRFINCSPYGVDSVILRNAAVTINIGSMAYFIGPAPSVSAIQIFQQVPRGTYQPLIFRDGLPGIAMDSIALGSRKATSLIYSGKKGATGADSLRLSVIFHPVL